MIDSTSPEYFFAIYTKAGKERVAAENLQRQGACVFAPFTKNARREVRPAFPRYIFAAFELDELFAKLRSTRGVSALVRFGDEFARIERGILLELVEHSPDGYVDFSDVENSPAFRYAVGEIMRVTFGEWMDSVVRISDYADEGYIVEPFTETPQGFNAMNLAGLLRKTVSERHLEPAAL